jgi:hypothetical protein
LANEGDPMRLLFERLCTDPTPLALFTVTYAKNTKQMLFCISVRMGLWSSCQASKQAYQASAGQSV